MAINNDGTIHYGSQDVLTITGGVTFTATRFDVDRPSKEHVQVDKDGDPVKIRSQDDVVRFTATLQLPTSKSYPAKFDTFTLTLDSAIGAETFLITNRKDTFEQEGEQFCEISGHVKLN